VEVGVDYGWDYLSAVKGGQLGSAIVSPAAPSAEVPNLIASVSFDRMDDRWAANYQARLRVRNAKRRAMLRTLTTRQAASIRSSLGISGAALDGLLGDVAAAQEELEALAGIPQVDIVESFKAMSADGIGSALGNLGLPIDVRAVIRGCAREQFRRSVGENLEILTYADADIDRLYRLIGDYGATAAEYFGEMRVAVSRYLGGNAAEVVDFGQRLSDWWRTTGDGTEVSLIRAQIEAAGAGMRGVVDRASAAADNFLTPELQTAAGTVIRAIQSGSSAPNAAALLSSIGGSLAAISPSLGPAAPYVAAAGAAVSAASTLGSLLADSRRAASFSQSACAIRRALGRAQALPFRDGPILRLDLHRPAQDGRLGRAVRPRDRRDGRQAPERRRVPISEARLDDHME
jgi:hypothetical protein